MTQAELDVLKNEYFKKEDGTDWGVGISTLQTPRVIARIATLSEKLQSDLILMIDTLDPLVA